MLYLKKNTDIADFRLKTSWNIFSVYWNYISFTFNFNNYDWYSEYYFSVALCTVTCTHWDIKCTIFKRPKNEIIYMKVILLHTNHGRVSATLLVIFRKVRTRIQTHVYGMCNGPTNALVCNKTLIQMSYIKTLKITPNMFRSSADHHQGAFWS
jgi:hypothetical protein